MHFANDCDAPSEPVDNLDDSIGGIFIQYLVMAIFMAVAMFGLVAV